jgi:hypothetical protein
MTPKDMAARASAIRLSHKRLGELSGHAGNTVGRVLGQRADRNFPQYQTQNDMERALIAEELRLRDHLLALHPVATATDTQPGRNAA